MQITETKVKVSDLCKNYSDNGIDREYTFDEMQGNHSIPWSQGGRTVEDNCQMLCSRHNESKSSRW